MSTRTRDTLGYAEDTIAETGDTGVVALGIDPTGKYIALELDATGALKVTTV